MSNREYEYNGCRLQTSQAANGRWTCFVNEDWIGIDTATEAEAIYKAKKHTTPAPPFGVLRRVR